MGNLWQLQCALQKQPGKWSLQYEEEYKLRIDDTNAYQRELREKQLSHISLFTLKKITPWQTKAAILCIEYKNIGVIKTGFHELCGIVNTPGGAALARFVQEIQIYRWHEILLS